MTQAIKWFCAAAGIAAILQGCALHNQDIRIDPTIDMPKSLTGSGKTIGLAVSDARETRKLGEVGDPNRQMFDIAVNEDRAPPSASASPARLPSWVTRSCLTRKAWSPA